MHLIHAIEISYFRSLYRIRLTNLAPLVVFSGRNDVGKSNVLKALNLFFNGRTDWQTDLNFYRDFSTERLQRVREETVKGKQFISVAIDFRRPEGYSGSLPEIFRVKRSWHRSGGPYSESHNLETQHRAGALPSTLETAKRFLPILLNRIHYEYVPAVKDRAFYDDLLGRLQQTLLDIPIDQDHDILRVADNLAEHIQGKIARLQEDFVRATGIKSAVVPPAELAAMFRAFQVSTEIGRDRVPLALRGDGIQARYVPSVLRYISDASSDFFMWGFEEPENSLEYSHVTQLADDLCNVYSQSAQIFCTTHSPAITSLDSGRNASFRVYREGQTSVASQFWPAAGTTKERVALNVEMGFMRIQQGLHEEYVRQQRFLEEVQGRLAVAMAEAAEASKPLVLTEGKHDLTILTEVWDKLYPGTVCPFLIRIADPADGEGGGSGGAGMLRTMIESFHPEEERFAVAVFDRDKKGVAEFNQLSKNFKRWQGYDEVKSHDNGISFALLLPVPDFRQDFGSQENLPLELLFPDDVIQRKNEEGQGLELKDPIVDLVADGRRLPVDTGQLDLPLAGLQRVRGDKAAFANDIVPTTTEVECRGFRSLFEYILQILQVEMPRACSREV